MPTFWPRAQSWWKDLGAGMAEYQSQQQGFDIDFFDVRGEYREGQIRRVR